MKSKNTLYPNLILAIFFFGFIITSPAMANEDSGLFFNSSAKLLLVIEGPLQKLVTEGKDDYASKGKNSSFYVDASVSLKIDAKSVKVPVELSLRGQTSVAVMDFPKYKIKFKDKHQLGQASLETLKIIGHGWEKDSARIVGQGAGIRATPLGVYREASVYDLLREAGLAVAQGRRAAITYQFTDVNKKITQPGFLIETYKTLGKRFGGAEIPLKEITPADLAKVGCSSWSAVIWLAEMMIGNWDFAIPTPKNLEGDLHNITLIRLSDGQIIPFMEDFNMSTMVSLNIQMDRGIDGSFHPEKSLLFRSMLWNMSSLKDEFSKKQIMDAVHYFLARKDILLKKIEILEVDESGRKNIRDHLLTFFEILGRPALIL